MKNSKSNTDPKSAQGRSLWSRRIAVLRFLLVEGGLLRDPIMLFTMLNSLGRTGLIYSINEIARQFGTWSTKAVALLVLSAFVMLFASYQYRVRAHLLIVKIKQTLRVSMTTDLLAADSDYLLSRPHGDIYAALTNNTDRLAGFVTTMVDAIAGVVLICFTLPYLFWISPSAGVATIVALVIGISGYVLLDLPARRYTVMIAQEQARFAGRVQDMLSGWREIRLSRARREAVEQETLGGIEKIAQDTHKAERLYAGSTVAGESSVVLLLCFTVAVVPWIQGGGATTAFQVLTVIFLTSGPIETMFNVLPSLSRAEVAYSRIQKVRADLAAASSAVKDADDSPFERFETLELRGVSAVVGGERSTDGESFQVGPVDLTFRPGETVFICGGNGSGKTTLLDVISGMRNPDQGQILLDGEVVPDTRKGGYRELFSAVFSDYHLFDKTYGLNPDQIARLEEHIVALNLSERVAVNEGKFSTLSLSAGQSRRLAFAIALAEQRPIIILDEFAADQDPANRARFYDVILPELSSSGQLILAVTHDEHQFGKSDRLIKMRAGKIISDERQNRAESA